MTSRLACLAAVLLVVAPCAGRAQFTALVTPPRSERRDSVVVVADSVPRAQLDTVRATELSDLKAWVDSAANVLSTAPPVAEPRTAPDSAPGPRQPARLAPRPGADSTGAPAATPRDPGLPRPPAVVPPALPAPAAPPTRRLR